MDCEENDFQSQNFHLVGDENKSPPGLQSFSLPKFDLDEHLQAHLRFDSLVDTEVLLGIQGQNNNWIEEFSSGTSAVEFSSSVAGNCSIIRHNNVWSEATSSESVEMLLRSVGEDEMSGKKAIAMEADAQNESHGLINQIDSLARQVDDTNSMMGDIIQNDPSVPPDKFQGSLLGQDKDGSSVPQVEGMCQIFSSEISISELDASSLANKLESDRKFSDRQCSTNVSVNLPVNDTTCLTVSETSYEMVQSDKTMDAEPTQAYDVYCCEESERTRGSTGSVACTSVQDDHSSVSNPVRSSGNSDSNAHLENVMKEHTAISITEGSEFLPYDGSKEESHVSGDCKGSEQFLETQEVSDSILTGDASSFLEPAMDSMVMITKGNVTGFPGNRDGLLEAITYQVKALKNGSDASIGSSVQANEMNSLATEGLGCTVNSVEIEEENILNQLTDCKAEHEEDNSQTALAVHVSLHMNSQTQLNETQDENVGSSHSNLGSLDQELAVIQKSDEAEVAEEVRIADFKFISAEDVMLCQLSLPRLVDNDEVKISSPISDKSHVAAEPADLTPSLKVSPGGDSRSSSPSAINLDTKGNSDWVKVEDSVSAGTDNKGNVADTSVSTTKKLLEDESGVAELAAACIESPSCMKYINRYQACPGNSLVVDEVIDDKEAASPKSPALDTNSSDGNEIKTSGISSCSNFCLPMEPLIKSDVVVSDFSSSEGRNKDGQDAKVVLNETVKFQLPIDSSAADAVPEHKVGSKSGLFSLNSTKSDESGSKISLDCNLTISDGNVDVKVSNRPLAESDTVKYDPPKKIREPQAINLPQSSSVEDKLITHVQTTVVQGNLDNCDFAVKENECFDKSRPSCYKHEGITIHFSDHPLQDEGQDEGQTLPVPPLIEKISDAPANLGITSVSLSRNNADGHQLEVESDKQCLPESSCGSPTVISCSEQSRDEPEGGDVDKVKSTTLESMESAASEDDKSFTFEVGAVQTLSGKDTGKWKHFSILQSLDPPVASKESSEGCHLESESKHDEVTTEAVSDDKAGNEDRASHITGSSERLTTPKGKPVKGISNRKKSSVSGRKSCSNSSTPARSRGRKSEEMQQHAYTESSSLKPSGSPTVQTASLPDLNSAISSATLFHQPFTNQQQIQLRAQIFVYGSLIQGIPPDEACMQSAFGETDSGRSSWESVWRMLVERQQNQRSPVTSETLRTHSGVCVREQVARCSSLQTEVVSSSSCISGVKILQSPVLNSTPPLASPLWSINTHDGLQSNLPRCGQLDFNQAVSPLYSCTSTKTRHYISSTPWQPQNSHFGPWTVSAHSPMPNASMQQSTVPVVETVLQVTPVRESSLPRAANVQLASPSSLLPTQRPVSIAPASDVLLEMQTKTGSLGNNKTASNVWKSRKKKTAVGTQDLAQKLPVSLSTSEPTFATVVPVTVPSAPVDLPLTAITTGVPISANLPCKFSSETTVVGATYISPTHYQIIGTGNTAQRVIHLEESGNKIEQAKLQAENAAAHAASVVAYSQGMWSKLASQKNSGLVTEVEEKLASAAVAAGAAASVAKAAAAAAKIASDAALQATIMADEALDLTKPVTLTQICESAFDAGKNFASLTPGSILKGKDKIHGSSSVVSAAREATRKRVEAASAAAKRAENLDAIMRAAELAAEAVFQAGTIVAMGDPLPFKLNELLEAGPDGYWKAHHSTSGNPSKVNDLPVQEHADLNIREEHYEKTPLNNKQIQQTAMDDVRDQDEYSVQSNDKRTGLGIGAGNESIVPNDNQERDKSISNLKENAIQKGSVVEVISNKDGLGGGWFSARVTDLKDNKACVCYNNLLADDGSGQLKEWVSLDNESNGAPRIRVAHPITVMKSDGTRKRRREVVGNYVWEVGDRVDAWMQDGWFGGVVIEKSQVDDTKIIVHFPGGNSLPVRAWDLRPSLTWKVDQWSRARETTSQPYEGDTPKEKRQKLGRIETKTDAEVDSRGTDKLLNKIPLEDSRKAREIKPLKLTAKDKIFSVGKNVIKENVSDLKVKRTGPQKEGSRVVSRVPNLAKKRKFMEVSKHYVLDKTDRTSQGNNSVKFAKYLMPQAPRHWRNTPKVESKGKILGDSKSGGLKSIKSQARQTGNTTVKENPSVATVSASKGRNNSRGASPNVRAGRSNKENKNSSEVVSKTSSVGTAEGLVAVSSEPLLSAPSTKNFSSTIVEALRTRERSLTVSDRSTGSEDMHSADPGKATPGVTEPRRSSRKIQPTSRLLEGLQSSLIISKIPSFSHDKGSKGQHRGSSSRGNTRG